MKKLIALLLSLVLVGTCAAAMAAYPEKPIECTIPWAAGGGADVAFRNFAEVFQKHTGQPIVMKYVPGASGSVGSVEFMNTAPADGYAIMHWSNAHVSKIHMSVVDFDVNSFKHVAQIVESANYLLVRADSKWNTIEEFVDDVLANPGMITVANAGVGGGNHIAALLFEEAIGGELAHITCDGGSGEVTSLLAGEVDAAMCNTPEGMANVGEGGDLKILCSFASKHFKQYPDVPLAVESSNDALKSLVIEQWRGIAVPVATPDDVVAELCAIVKEVVEDPEYVEKCDALQIVARFRDTEEYTAFNQAEDARFENLIKTKGFGDRYGK